MKPDHCQICGAAVPISEVHLVPRSLGSRREPGSVLYLCPNCNAQLDRGNVHEFEFESILAKLMSVSGTYAEVTRQPDLSTTTPGTRLRPDILARTPDGAIVLVECKSALTVAEGRLRGAFDQLKRYQEIIGADELVLALPARLTPEQKESARQANVQAWDLDEIAARFRHHLGGVTHPVLKPMLLAVAALGGTNAGISPEAALIAELRALPSGRAHWVAYQKLVSKILERLFCPPLSTPIIERADDSGTNRRDIILPNYAERGFWAFVRERYDADFLVVDAKNHTEEIGKPEALQVLNYLKCHGTGMLGMIVCRRGWDATCQSIIREKWALEGKLVVVLSDEHVERMLRAKEAGGPPEDVVRQWIEDFRISM